MTKKIALQQLVSLLVHCNSLQTNSPATKCRPTLTLLLPIEQLLDCSFVGVTKAFWRGVNRVEATAEVLQRAARVQRAIKSGRGTSCLISSAVSKRECSTLSSLLAPAFGPPNRNAVESSEDGKAAGAEDPSARSQRVTFMERALNGSFDTTVSIKKATLRMFFNSSVRLG